MSAITATVQLRRDTAANWTTNNPTLLAGEVGWETDTKRAKLGDGTTAWTSLAYIDPSWLIDNSVTNAKLANMAEATIKGRQAGSGTGDPEDLTPSQARTAMGLGSLATQSGTFSGTSSGTNTGDQDLSGLMVKANNLSDLTNAATARTNLGLGTAAVANTGTGASDVPTITQGDARYLRSVISVLSSTFTTSSAAYVDITGLAVTLDANSTYVVEVMAIVQSSNTSTGANVSMTVSGSPTTRTFDRRAFFTPTTAIDAVINTDDGGATTGTTDAANANRPLNMTGLVVTAGSASTIQLRAVRAGSANNISILAGSTIIARKVA